MIGPLTRLPRPTGPHAIGTLLYHWIDEGRPEVFTRDPSDRRELLVQLWYPADTDPSATPAPYIDDPRAVVALARLIGLPASAFDHLSRLRTHAVPAAPMAGAERRPVLVFSHGRCGVRQHNTVQVEELVSHGYVVAAVDHPYVASGVTFPDGRFVGFDQRLAPPWPRVIPPGPDREVLANVFPYLVEDVRFVLDRLTDLDRADPDGILRHRLDLDRIGIFGPSLGGIVAAEACRVEPRLSACLAMDVFMPRDVVSDGLAQPAMWMTRPAATMRDEGWDPAEIEDTQASIRATFERDRSDAYLVRVPGMYHIDFSDGRLLSPLIEARHLCGPIDGGRSRRIVNAYSRAFFDRHLRGRPAPLIDRASDDWPEVLLETHHAASQVRAG